MGHYLELESSLNIHGTILSINHHMYEGILNEFKTSSSFHALVYFRDRVSAESTTVHHRVPIIG